MAFTPLDHDAGKVRTLLMGTGVTVTKFQHCAMSSGYLIAGVSGDVEASYIALETKTNSGADGAASVDVLPIDETIQFEALCQDTPVQATHVGNDYDFQSAAQLDLDATTNKVFHIDSIKDATNKLVLGHFNKPALA